MKSCGENAALLDENGMTFGLGEDFYLASQFFDNWRANENHFQRTIAEL